MTTKIIGVVRVKVGAGRSTVSTNLAGKLSKQGKTVLTDCALASSYRATDFKKLGGH